jgi:hypothetical protein
METSTKIIKTVNIELTEDEALALRTLLNNHIDAYWLPDKVNTLVNELNEAVKEL